MKYTSTFKAVESIKTDAICIPLFEDKKASNQAFDQVNQACENTLEAQIKAYGIKRELGSSFTLPIANQPFARIIFFGLGKSSELTDENQVKAAKALAAEINASSAKNAVIATEDVPCQPALIQSLVLSIANEHYNFDEYKSKKADKTKLTQVQIHSAKAQQSEVKSTLTFAQALALGVATTKDLGNQPGNVCTPSYLANQARALAKSNSNIKVSILEEKDMEKLNMGAFLSVSKGSTEPGKLITIEYNGGKKGEAPHAIVGKGITFDTGGISLKPGAQMDEMKYDMCGAASVLGTLTAIAELQPKINIVGMIAAAENMPAGNASKPGDIVTTSSGQTVEIMNTDAEGRLVLCDALTYVGKYKPASVVDIATLTGACIIALGHHTSGLMSNNDALVEELLSAGKQANDKAWQLPLGPEYDEQINSPFADMQNIGGKGAGTITAGAFLARFAKEYKWAHLDIAGTAWVSGGMNKGATGRPVPLLLQYLMNKVA